MPTWCLVRNRCASRKTIVEPPPLVASAATTVSCSLLSTLPATVELDFLAARKRHAAAPLASAAGGSRASVRGCENTAHLSSATVARAPTVTSSGSALAMSEGGQVGIQNGTWESEKMNLEKWNEDFDHSLAITHSLSRFSRSSPFHLRTWARAAVHRRYQTRRALDRDAAARAPRTPPSVQQRARHQLICPRRQTIGPPASATARHRRTRPPARRPPATRRRGARRACA